MIELTSQSVNFWNRNPKNENEVFALYGAGSNAEVIIAMAKRAGLKIDCIIDTNKQGHYFNNLNIYSPETFQKTFFNKEKKHISNLF
ncbi:MAG: hypothetical protein PHV37_02415 [Candidatus Gastranaerophilales bacterium]|nr:hypothetical protein [Candidatus Gastranaerophilales bacterium]